MPHPMRFAERDRRIMFDLVLTEGIASPHFEKRAKDRHILTIGTIESYRASNLSSPNTLTFESTIYFLVARGGGGGSGRTEGRLAIRREGGPSRALMEGHFFKF